MRSRSRVAVLMLSIGLLLTVVGLWGCDATTTSQLTPTSPAQPATATSDTLVTTSTAVTSVPTSDSVPVTYPAPAFPEQMPADFGFVAAYGVGAKNVIDTFVGTFIKDLGPREDPVTTGLRLAPEELETLYRDIVEMQTSWMLFTIAPFAIDPDPQRTGTTMMVTPYISYRLEWRIGDFRYNPIVWDDTSLSSDPRAVALRDWFKKLQQMIEAKPEWKALPPMQGGYA